MRLIATALVLVLMSGCSNMALRHFSGWSPEMLDHLRMTSDEWGSQEILNFSTDHNSVAVTVNEDGLCNFFALQWRIEGDWLVLFDSRGKEWERLRFRSAGPFILTVVRHDGKVARFTYNSA